MSTINSTIQIGEDSASVIAAMVSKFAPGQRVRVSLSDELLPLEGTRPDLVDWLLGCPEKDWFTPEGTSETTDDLRPLRFE